MKSMFPQYKELTSVNFDVAWKYGLFVFDTNVLLNLYRYQATTRDELISVLGQLSDRVWIPHHVALEFQRNRLKVIAEQGKRFSDVRKAIESARSTLFGELEKLQLLKRHSLINPQPLTSGFEALVDKFLAELESLQQGHQKLTEPDPLKEQIETQFNGKVGQPPKDQAFVDEVYKEADARFKLKIPPGYEDKDKDKDEPDEHLHNGIIYKRKFGDYLVWRQILTFAKEKDIKYLIFVTDDGKEDWWRKIKSEGPKTIGPRTELIEEAHIHGGVETFLMYNPEGFLKYSKEFLKANISEETLKEVRDVSLTRSLAASSIAEFREHAMRAELCVLNWLLARFETVEETRTGFPDFIAHREGKRYGFEVKLFQNPRFLHHRMKEIIYRSFYELNTNGFYELAIIIIVPDVENVEEAKRICMRLSPEKMPSTLRIIIGLIEADSEGSEFIPYDEVCWPES